MLVESVLHVGGAVLRVYIVIAFGGVGCCLEGCGWVGGVGGGEG